MSAAERYTALKALQFALTEALKVTFEDVERDRVATGAKSFDTQYGSLTMTKRKPSIGYDAEGLLAWAKENASHEVVVTETVRDSLRKTLDKRFSVDGDDVVDTKTGEVVEWAHVKPGSEFLTAKLDPDAKAGAVETVLARLDQLTHVLEIGS